MMLLTLRGTPFIYYGEEIGMTDVRIPRERIVDVDGRDPERTPMQWDATRNAGFTTGKPWLPIASNMERGVNVAAQRDDPSSMFSFYRRLIQLRRGSAALRGGSYFTLHAPSGVFAYLREAEDARLVVALNFFDRPRRVALPREATLMLSTTGERTGKKLGTTFELAPNEGLIAQLT
jgi:alpha-glucosidase